MSNQPTDQPELPGNKTIVILPLEAVETATGEQLDALIDAAIENAERIQLAETFARRLNAPPIVMRFIDQHLTQIRTLNERGHRHRGKGCVFILDRLDEPPPTYAPGYSIDTTQKPTYIGGYQAVFARLDQLKGDRTALAAAREHSQQSTVVLRVNIADPTNPDAYDQPHIIVIPSDYTPGEAEFYTPKEPDAAQPGAAQPGAAQPDHANEAAAPQRRRSKKRTDPMP